MRSFFMTSLLAVGLSVAACGGETTATDTPATSAAMHTGNWAVIKDESHVNFTATQSGDAFTGQFKAFTADINFDADNVEAASVKAVIDLSSVDAGDKERDGALPGKDWFYVKEYPSAIFTSDDFRKTGENTYEAHGDLTIRDMTKPVILPFILNIDGERADMSGSVEINRGDFGVGQGSWKTDEWVSLNVKIDVKIAASRR